MNSFKFIVILFFVLIHSCGLKERRFDGTYTSPESYDLTKGEKLIIPEVLDEVSGITIGDNGNIWAIQDEASIVYELKWPNKKILRKSKFAKNMDLEDILYTEKGLYGLKSNGDIYEIINVFEETVSSVSYDFPFDGKRDLESLAQLSDDQAILFCKSCKLDKDNEASAFVFDFNTKTYSEIKDYKLTEKELRKILHEETDFKLTIKPSAAVMHPIERKLYVISSVGKWLLIMDKFGDAEEIHRLDPRLFKQAEGITFNQRGDMFISNEAHDGNPNILKFDYLPQSKK
ncbi:SdiA-regulated domain-containing protein [Echinicola marina]|uniref:SdiA-regulated domain-containing protein n=1 Tax=Echinicola marina TaxID=2859768 RepID=UPI001CF68BBC|nr:SdiA-regulated domain-containing protein [Echinicola marina]UCS92478.1 SdiA-regulated domain-containing protein [Echinicola marina]